MSDTSILTGRTTVEMGKTWNAIDYYNWLASAHGNAFADIWLNNVTKNPTMFLDPQKSNVPANPLAGLASPNNRVNLGGTSANPDAYLVNNPVSGGYSIISQDGTIYTGYGNVNVGQLPRGTTIGGQYANTPSNVGLPQAGVSPLVPATPRLRDILINLLQLILLIPQSGLQLAHKLKT